MTTKTTQEPRYSLHELSIFVAIAQLGTTRAAAERSARSQAAVSAALSTLEAALDAPLFDRVGRRLVLNENGHKLLPKAASLLDQAWHLQHLLHDSPSVPLQIAASMTIGEYLLPRLLVPWQAQHPHSPVHMSVGNTRAVVDALVRFEADVGFVEGPESHPDLVARTWLSDRMVIVAAPSHPLAGTLASRAQLQQAVWATREPGSGTRSITDHWLFDQLGQTRVAFELGSTEAVKQLVASGAGIACLSIHALEQALAQGWLAEVHTRLKLPVRRLAIVQHRDKRLGPQAEAFVRHCLAR